MAQYHQETLQVAGISFRIESALPLHMEQKFRAFCREDDAPGYTIRLRCVEVLPELPETVVHAELNYRVHRAVDGAYLTAFSNPPWDHTVYAAAAFDYDHGLIRVDHLESGIPYLSDANNLFSHLNFEELLLRKGRLCLHASCVDTPLGGILFSGPSGIGKSTQSDLWRRYRGGVPINGDRPILSRDGGNWLAWGSPYAGSSDCHVNANCPVRAIVMLGKGAQCKLRKLSVAEAFRKVWSGVTVHSWDESYVTAALGLTQDLVEAVPVYELICTPDERAVTCLEDALRRECDL